MGTRDNIVTACIVLGWEVDFNDSINSVVFSKEQDGYGHVPLCLRFEGHKDTDLPSLIRAEMAECNGPVDLPDGTYDLSELKALIQGREFKAREFELLADGIENMLSA